MNTENKPNLGQEKSVLEHHPHHGMPPHGTIHKARPWHQKIVAATHEAHSKKAADDGS